MCLVYDYHIVSVIFYTYLHNLFLSYIDVWMIWWISLDKFDVSLFPKINKFDDYNHVLFCVDMFL
jgi:hypothetical protein